MQPNGDKSPIDHRCTVPEAAGVLGISPEAVRARIHRGTLQKEKAPDGTVYVRLNDDQSRSNGDDTPDRSTAEELLKEQVAYLRDQLDQERAARTEERRRHDTIVAALTSRIPELEAPQERPHAPETATAGADRVERPATDGAQEGTERRSWWRRFFGFE
jgi:hypothetical protein